jgi:hypothetical protein
MKQRAGSVAGGGPAEGVSLAPDVESSTDSYAARFAGSLGDWFLERQAASVIRLLSALECRSVLDIGGGHGQLTGTLRGAGYEVIMQEARSPPPHGSGDCTSVHRCHSSSPARTCSRCPTAPSTP